jgi:hypothetical protein
MDPLWGQWVHDDRVAGSLAASILTPADVTAPNGSWNQSPPLTVAAAPAGIYLAIAQASFALSAASGTVWAGIKKTTDPANTNATAVIVTMTVGQKLAVPIIQLFNHSGGDLAVHITFGNSGASVQAALNAQSRLALVRIGPLP